MSAQEHEDAARTAEKTNEAYLARLKLIEEHNSTNEAILTSGSWLRRAVVRFLMYMFGGKPPPRRRRRYGREAPMPEVRDTTGPAKLNETYWANKSDDRRV